MSPNQLLLQQGDHHPATGQPYYLLRPATVTAMTGNDNDTTNDASNANLGDKNVVLDEVHAAWYNAQLNGLETISGFGGVGGELIQENFQEQLPVTPILLDQNGNVKKEEDVKEENQLATVVSVYVPPPELPVLPAEPIVLGIGEIPPGFETKQDRRELLDRTVQKLSEGNQPMRMDLATRNTMRFIDGKIEGLFETHLLMAAHEEVRNVNKRTRNRKRRNRKSEMKKQFKKTKKHASSSSSVASSSSRK